MGLDMFLYRFPKIDLSPSTIYAADNFIHVISDDMIDMFISWYNVFEGRLPTMRDIKRLFELCPDGDFVREVGYWRKANAIHKWFVDNVQDGEDDCQYHRPVTKNDLETLKGLCKEVLNDHSKADKLLQSMDGFFFGVYDYDDIYFEKIQYTYNLCKKLIEEFDFDNYELYYVSSW